MGRFSVAVVVALMLSSGCHDEPMEPYELREIGVIDRGYEGTRGVLTAPDTVQVNQSFDVAIRTFGNVCYRADGFEMTADSNSVTITPYDIVEYGSCGYDEGSRLTSRTVRLRFDRPGTMILKIVGRRVGAETGGEPVPTSFTHPIHVIG